MNSLTLFKHSLNNYLVSLRPVGRAGGGGCVHESSLEGLKTTMRPSIVQTFLANGQLRQVQDSGASDTPSLPIIKHGCDGMGMQNAA